MADAQSSLKVRRARSCQRLDLPVKHTSLEFLRVPPELLWRDLKPFAKALETANPACIVFVLRTVFPASVAHSWQNAIEPRSLVLVLIISERRA